MQLIGRGIIGMRMGMWDEENEDGMREKGREGGKCHILESEGGVTQAQERLTRISMLPKRYR
jgi:hypothetical protein